MVQKVRFPNGFNPDSIMVSESFLLDNFGNIPDIWLASEEFYKELGGEVWYEEK